MRYNVSSDKLIFDLGLHDGADTRFYLEKGFQVVAVEANPQLIALANERFADEIHSGRLKLVHAAVHKDDGPVDFMINLEDDLWSSVSENAPEWTESERVVVPGLTPKKLFEKYGVPYYLKIDIEGADHLCLAALPELSCKPDFVSFECSIGDFESNFEAVSMLWQSGYRKFKLVNQATLVDVRCPNPPREGNYVDARFDGDCSGPFGEESPGDWNDLRRLLSRLDALVDQHKTRREFEKTGKFAGIQLGKHRNTLKAIYNSLPVRLARKSIAAVRRHEVGGWFDIHAKFEDVI